MSSKNHQVAGEHYKKRAIQPIEYIVANELPFCEGNIVKYVTRHRDKGGREDIEKLIQYAQFILDEYDRVDLTPFGEAAKAAYEATLKRASAQRPDGVYGSACLTGSSSIPNIPLPRTEPYPGQSLDTVYYDPITEKYYSK